MANLPYMTRPLIWLGSSKEDLSAFPKAAKRTLGAGLRFVQNGLTPAIAKPLGQFGSGVFELREKFAGESYRVVYAAKLSTACMFWIRIRKSRKKGRPYRRRSRRGLKPAWPGQRR